jgi:hypothetical protein
MGQVNGQVEKDIAAYRAWVDGATQGQIAAARGVTQQAISKAIGRVLDQLPEPDKAAEVRRAVEQADEALAVYLPKALTGDTAASREARGWSLLKHRWLGGDRREVQVEHTGQVQVQVLPLDQVVDRIQARQGLPASTTVRRLP